MSKPAARMGDATAHGGTIVAGCPTVLIGGQPAARLGDMHTCPMQTPGTPPIPHVGGPDSEAKLFPIVIGNVSGNGVRKGEIDFHGLSPP